MKQIYDKYHWINDDLVKIVERMKDITKTGEEEFNDSVFKMFEAKSKMLRPLFLLTTARMYGLNDESYTMGAAIEMLHVASLVHDDIIDDSEIRRGVESIQHAHGKGFAVIAGDYLFTRALATISKSSKIKDMSRTLETIVDMTAGEITQHYEKYRNDLSIDNYYRVIDGKTASLFSLSLFLGGLVASAPKKAVDSLSEIGKLFGRAFQIFDDLKDFEQNEVDLGKPVMNDLNKGIYTLPTLIALKNNEELRREVNKNVLSDDFHERLINEVYNSGALDEARLIANSYVENALNLAYNLKSCNERELLIDLIQIVK